MRERQRERGDRERESYTGTDAHTDADKENDAEREGGRERGRDIDRDTERGRDIIQSERMRERGPQDGNEQHTENEREGPSQLLTIFCLELQHTEIATCIFFTKNCSTQRLYLLMF